MNKAALTLAVLVAASHSAFGTDPRAPVVGTTQTLPVVSVSISVGNTGAESKRGVYAPPPGWYVRSHRVVTADKRGSVSYTVSTVPAGWAWRAEEQTTAEAKAAGSAAVTAYKVSGGAQAATATATAATELQANASSHHLLVVDVSARGCGLWKGDSGVELTVVAELVYLGTPAAKKEAGERRP
ncbi:unnamed protein product [Gemmataceae bacterium]|nr:unnamed protein product [Gemmataceae bacterium]VTU02811.1 unnamed protein product [Gemmataceae bacterium]